MAQSQLERVREHLDNVAIAGVIDKNGNSFYDHLHKAIEIVEKLIAEAEARTNPA